MCVFKVLKEHLSCATVHQRNKIYQTEDTCRKLARSIFGLALRKIRWQNNRYDILLIVVTMTPQLASESCTNCGAYWSAGSGEHFIKDVITETLVNDPGFVYSDNVLSASSAGVCRDLCCETCDVAGADYTSSLTTNQQSAADNCIYTGTHARETTPHTLWVHGDIQYTERQPAFSWQPESKQLPQWWRRQSGLRERCWQTISQRHGTH